MDDNKPILNPIFQFSTGEILHDFAENSNQAPNVERKPLPINLQYKYLRLNQTYPIIINASLNQTQTDELLDVLSLSLPPLILELS
jgi:hypothetical protein